MPAIKIRDLAEGFLKKHKSEVKTITDRLTSVGKASAIKVACSALHTKTGLPESRCVPIATLIVNKLAKDVRDKLANK